MSSPRTKYHLSLLIAAAGLIYFFQLGAAPLWDRDEPRNAGCAAEMMEADDWVVPIFNDQLRTHKPVLLYWLMMSSYAVFGVNEFGARFFSALLAIGTVLLTYGMGRRLFQAEVGKWAGLILSSTIMFSVAARAATPDSLLVFCSTLSIALFIHFAFAEREKESTGAFPKSRWTAALIYAPMGLGVLAKGPVGVVLPTAVIGMYLLIIRLESRRSQTSNSWTANLVRLLRPFEPRHFLGTCWSMRPFTAIATVCAVALPWYMWVSARTNGVWTDEFFWTHNISRAAKTMEGHSGPPILFYLGAIMVGFFPWSILTIPTGMHLHSRTTAIQGEQRDDYSQLRFRRGVTLLMCWIGVYIGIFSIAQTKLPSYVTPCYPSLALLAGLFVNDWRTATSFQRVWLKVGLGNLIAVGVLLLGALPLVTGRFLPGSEWLGLLGLVPLVGGVLCWRSYANANHRSATTTLAMTAVAFLVLLMGVVPAEIGRHRQYDELFHTTSNHDGPIASYGHLEPSWIFYGDRSIRDFEVTEQEEFSQFLTENPNALVITTPERIRPAAGLGSIMGNQSNYETSDQAKLFADFELVHRTEYFLRDRPLLLFQQRSELPPSPIVAERDRARSRK